MKKPLIFLALLILNSLFLTNISAQYLIYDDKMALEVYSKELLPESKDGLIAIINDKGDDPYKRAAAVSVLRTQFFHGLNAQDNTAIQQCLRKVFRRGGSSFIRIEIAYALCQLDRDKYFKDMVPFLLKRIDNENNIVSERAFERVTKILNEKPASRLEANIVFNNLKKSLKPLEEKHGDNQDFRTANKQQLFNWANSVLKNNKE